jgi:hypothetical protein
MMEEARGYQELRVGFTAAVSREFTDASHPTPREA